MVAVIIRYIAQIGWLGYLTKLYGWPLGITMLLVSMAFESVSYVFVLFNRDLRNISSSIEALAEELKLQKMRNE